MIKYTLIKKRIIGFLCLYDKSDYTVYQTYLYQNESNNKNNHTYNANNE